MSSALCNRASVNSIFASNHTLEICHFSRHTDRDIIPYLKMNRWNSNKKEVARKKIICYHFQNGMSNIQDLAQMDPTLMPHVVAWIGGNGLNIHRVQLMYQLCRSAPSLFELKNNAKGAKRRKGFGLEQENVHIYLLKFTLLQTLHRVIHKRKHT